MVDAITITASIFGVGTSITRPKLDHSTKPYAISSVKYLLSTWFGPGICENTGLVLNKRFNGSSSLSRSK